MSATLIQYYDNWSITFAVAVVVPAEPARPIPALSVAMLMMLALLVALGALAARSTQRVRQVPDNMVYLRIGAGLPLINGFAPRFRSQSPAVAQPNTRGIL